MNRRTKIKLASLSLILSAAIVVCAVVFPQSVIAQAGKAKRLLPVYSVDRSDNCIAISFDCAWGVEHTDELLNAMNDYGVKCTFFAVSFWVEKYPEYCKKIVENGHEMGTHSATHSHMSKLTEAAITEELLSSTKLIESVTGKKVELFRCPFGEYNDTVISSAKKAGLHVIQWDVDSLDWKDLTAEQIATRVVSKTKSGSIILCHNNGLNTAKALPLIFEALKVKGFTFKPISELIYKENYEINANGVQHQINV